QITGGRDGKQDGVPTLIVEYRYEDLRKNVQVTYNGKMVLSTACWCVLNNQATCRDSHGWLSQSLMINDIDLSDQGKGIIRKTHQKFQYEKDYRQVDQDFQL